ncbi:MAG: hypothetical protein IBJ16_00185 [Chitinophagaceae bacterium]|nr:hypothetical protein [Chitinophagaceae bacterium]
MKTLFLFLICLCLSASTFSQQRSNRQASRPKKVLPPPKTDQEHLADARTLYSLRLCNAAKASYSFVTNQNKDQSLINAITQCLVTPKASLDEAGGFDPAIHELSALNIPINQQVGYENVEFGNEEFAAQRYRNAIHFFLTYLTDNFSKLKNNIELLKQFEEKIEYCYDQLRN